MLSRGHCLAIDQLESISAVSKGKINIVNIGDPNNDLKVSVLIKIDCSEFERTDDGLSIRNSENFTILIPEDFPFSYPSVWVNHVRFSGFSHVQWNRYLCLFLSPEIEWNPSDGMFGFMERLVNWLSRAANNTHEKFGEPLHPPVTYNVDYSKPFIVAQKNTPPVKSDSWIGFASLEVINDKRHDLIGWKTLTEVNSNEEFIAAAILLNKPFPFEYPKKAEELIRCLNEQGVNVETLQVALTLASLFSKQNMPLYLIIGTPMRGIRGSVVVQHLAIWSFPEQLRETINLQVQAQFLSEKLNDKDDVLKCKSLSQDCKMLVRKTIELSPVSWSCIEENRPEATQRRDKSTPVSWFKEKKICLWGCGAIGSHIAELLVRAGVSHITIRDKKCVTPGTLVRQNYLNKDIGVPKVKALKTRLKEINPETSVFMDDKDIGQCFAVLPELKDDSDYDLIFDATASNLLAIKFEGFIKNKMIPPVVSLVTGQSASSAIMTYKPSNYFGGHYEINRRIKIKVGHQEELLPYLNEFWPNDDSFDNFQPEPGCSDPTFIGSQSDMMQLCGSALNKSAEVLQSKEHNVSKGFLLAGRNAKFVNWHFEFKPYYSIQIVGSAEVRISQAVWHKISTIIQTSEEHEGRVCEIGGLIFGQYDQANDIIWVSEVIAPPSDSVALPEHFECGIAGTEEVNNKLSEVSRGSVQYLGMWHTHPISSARPSQTDIQGMEKIIFEGGFTSSSQLLLIVGFSDSNPELGVHLFSTKKFNRSGNNQLIYTEMNQNGRVKAIQEIKDEI